MKLGFVSRATRTDADNHVIVGTASFPPAQLATQASSSVLCVPYSV